MTPEIFLDSVLEWGFTIFVAVFILAGLFSLLVDLFRNNGRRY